MEIYSTYFGGPYSYKTAFTNISKVTSSSILISFSAIIYSRKNSGECDKFAKYCTNSIFLTLVIKHHFSKCINFTLLFFFISKCFVLQCHCFLLSINSSMNLLQNDKKHLLQFLLLAGFKACLYLML